MGTKNLFRAAMATVVGAVGFVLFSASPAGATYFSADRQCDGTVQVHTYGVGYGLHVTLTANGVTWELWAGDEETVSLPPVDGDSVVLTSDYEYEDGTTWTTDYTIPISPPPAEECTPPGTPTPPTTTPPISSPPTEQPPPPPPVEETATWTVEPFCRNDTPYLSVTAVVPDSAGTPITLHWVDAAGNERLTQQVPVGTSEVLWPGATIDGNGNPTDWPGWIQENDAWLEADDGFAWARTASVYLSANPSSPTFPAAYPPSTPTCSARPVVEILRASATPTAAPSLPETGAGVGPLVVLGVALLAAGGLLVVGARQRAATASMS